MRGSPTSFWGKLDKDEAGAVLAWHPLEDHCADVAACAEQLLNLPVLRASLARLGGLPDLSDVQIERLAALAALHDVGKFNHGFQRKAHPKPRDPAGHVKEVIALFGSGYQEEERLCTALRVSTLEQWADDPDTPLRLLLASICHHGKPVALESSPRPSLWAPHRGVDPMAGIAALAEQVFRWFPQALAPEAAPLPAAAEFQHAFSGLVTLADWLGSDRDIFPYRREEEPPDRMSWSRAQARMALKRMGVDAHVARELLGPRAPGFKEFFDIDKPRAIQELVTQLPVDAHGGITVLEAETGSGKTEAALARFIHLFHAGAVDGLYFALPTRTAATQIHTRVVSALKRLFPSEEERPPVVLAVPEYLKVDDQRGRALPGFEVLWNDDEQERWRFRGWAAEHPKRFLAGAIVIGTIDQALMSALAVSHSHLRATALLRHLLVVDEVHASDAYMTVLLQDVLRRHLAAGGHALLMSATLGSEARERLLTPASPPSPPPLEEACATPYPAISHAPARGTRSLKGAPSGESGKRVRAVMRGWMAEPRQVAERALEAAAQGACVIVLRNTVRDCLHTQRALEALAADAQQEGLLFSCRGSIAPHHARFAREDRTALDGALEERFGKQRLPGTGCVVVATQTIQQSLDLDADLLLTDLCPMDVLLQRVGRLHRHSRARPAPFEQATVEVLTPPERSLTGFIRQNGEAKGPHGLGRIYEDLRIIEATWRELEARELLEIPQMNRELVERTTHPEALEAIVRSLEPPWERHGQEITGKIMAHRKVARLNLAVWSKPFGEARFPSHELHQHIKARLGDGDRRVSFTPPLESPFRERFERLTLPAWFAKSAPHDAFTAEAVRHEGQRIHFTFGDAEFLYDRLGMRPAEEDAEDDRA